VEEVDLEELGLFVNTPVDELHLDPLGVLDSEVVTLGLAVVQEETLGEKDEAPDTVSRKTEGVGATVWVIVVVSVAVEQGDGVKLTVTLSVGLWEPLFEASTESEKEALPVVLLDAEGLPLGRRDTDPLLVAFAGVGDPEGVWLPHPLTEAEKEEDLEALALPLGRRVAEVHREAKGEREDDPL